MRNWIYAAIALNAVLTGIGILIHPASATGRDGLLSLLAPTSPSLYI